ncbi:DUF3021 domain-containing protein [Clostridium cellulovorans]|uniref:DUF3021 domain-containing protein n=1 Tax=Clostridium cellulovorans (strain ATCC 35296 / DSM 3052 / OCM 3 / 743B) TaxID=573061 RepID=D9SV49_CLOC7|nr:DUF3021 domain-containing protein [Clostridium cellulovorans]ADL53023.1 Protein of unknown function DUF3021 [Clostridium cellulovorans 743B]
MNLIEFIKKLIRDFFIIFALIVISLTITRQIFQPNDSIELRDMYIYMICSLIVDLLSLIFYSERSISEKEMWIRRIIHFFVLEAALLILANLVGSISGIGGIVLLQFQIAVIYISVLFISWTYDKKTTDKINEKLKAMRDEL